MAGEGALRNRHALPVQKLKASMCASLSPPAEVRDYQVDDCENKNTALVIRLTNPSFEWKSVCEMQLGRIN